MNSPLRISSVNVTKSQFPVDVAPFTEEILNGKLNVENFSRLTINVFIVDLEKVAVC